MPPRNHGRGMAGTDHACRIKDLNEHCLEEFRNHWKCLDNQNHQLWNCRSLERRLNSCVFDKLVCLLPVLLHCARLTCPEIGEGDTRYAQGRNTSAPAGPPDLFVELSCVYYVRTRNTKHVNSTFQQIAVMHLFFRGAMTVCRCAGLHDAIWVEGADSILRPGFFSRHSHALLTSRIVQSLASSLLTDSSMVRARIHRLLLHYRRSAR